jgi:oligoendopeptidase F
MNSVGLHGDVQTLLHEGGHAFHAILSRDEPLVDYRNAPIEFAETASMSMELMGLEEIEPAYSAEEARRARRSHFEHVLRLLPWIASIDAFQHRLYAQPGHDRASRKARWLEIRARLGPGIDYRGFEDALAYQWSGQPHLYGSPLYYIEYGIAQVAALQIWLAYRRDREAAVEAYRTALAYGGALPLPALFEAAGVRFDLSPAMLAALVAEVETVLAAR